MNLLLPDEAATEALAARIAARAAPGDAILLSGPLGAGKSVFARAFIRALAGVPDLPVPSPSFTLLQTYDTPRGAVWHYDLWRLNDHHALEELGWDEATQHIILVEWPERLGPLTPVPALRLTLAYAESGRYAELAGEQRWLHGS
jgi:tRNA threonylcarbamoyladenosine biosynthesis protein TsaE